MKLGVVTYELGRDWDIPTLLDQLPRLGFAGVELRTTHAHGVEETLSPTDRAEVRRQFAASPVELVGLGSTYEFHSLDPAELRANIEGTKRACALASDVGAGGVKVRPNGDNVARGIPRTQTLDQIGHALHECGLAAADSGVVIRLEMHGTVGDAIEMRHVIDVADHPNVVLVWNSNARFDIDASGSIASDFHLVRDHIGLVHMHDLTDQVYPWPELLGLLATSGYDGYCLAECAPASSDPARVLTYYRALFHAYRRLAEQGDKRQPDPNE